MQVDPGFRRWLFKTIIGWLVVYGSGLILLGTWVSRGSFLRGADYAPILGWLLLVCAGVAGFILKDDLRAALRSLRRGGGAWLALIGNVSVFLGLASCLLLLGLESLLWWNQAADRSASVVIQAEVLEILPGSGGRILIGAWQLADDPIPLPVEPDLRERLQEGSRLRLTVGRGALNIAWIRNVSVVE